MLVGTIAVDGGLYKEGYVRCTAYSVQCTLITYISAEFIKIMYFSGVFSIFYK